MATTYHDTHKDDAHDPVAHTGELRVNEVDTDQALLWIEAGWRDFLNSPGHSLLYGIIFSISCLFVVFMTQQYPGFVLSFLTGLMLIGPFLAVGAYTASWQLHHGHPVSISEGFSLLKARATNLSFFAAMLLVVLMAWIRISSLVFAVQFQFAEPTAWSTLGRTLFGTTEGAMMLGFFILIGFVLAAAVFVLSAVTVPMIIDRDTNAFVAVRYSFQAVMANKKAMAFWAFMIVVLCGVSITTGFILMTVIFPVLGYATWHSYKDLVSEV